MKLSRPENLRWYALLCGLVAMLALLAVLQYRSVQAVSAATTEQMRASLRGSLMDVRQALDRELRSLCNEFDFSSRPDEQNALPHVVTGFERWRSITSHPALVHAIYVFEKGPETLPRLLKLKPTLTDFEPVAWPQEFTRLRDRLIEFPPAPMPMHEGDPGARSRESFPPPVFFQSESDRSEPPPGRPTFQRRDGFRRVHFSPWLIDESIPALIHPFFPPPFRRPDQKTPPSPQWLVIVLDRGVLSEHLLPDLIQRYFGSKETSAYEVAVIDRNGYGPDLYVSDPSIKNWNHRPSDAALNLFGRPVPFAGSGTPDQTAAFIPPPPAPQIAVSAPLPTSEDHAERLRSFIEPLHYNDNSDQDWEIVAKHRQGSVEAAVASLSRRNLIFNFAVLLVLAATMAVIIAASLRARRLGQLQMDFVANVSHELRTPLTGIMSAGENIADGLINDKEKISLYGKAIVREAHQLTELVEQILQFSAIQRKGDRYHLEPVNIAEVLDFSLKNTSALIRSADVKVEQDLQSRLPPVTADFKALSRCLQNLIGNAVKYGGDANWIGIRAWLENYNGASKICVSVADKGIGIRPEDLNQIFEPFYRAPEATAAQIHGTGLGLPLARRIAEAMGGSLTVESEFGEGSTFTLRLPAK